MHALLYRIDVTCGARFQQAPDDPTQLVRHDRLGDERIRPGVQRALTMLFEYLGGEPYDPRRSQQRIVLDDLGDVPAVAP
jgi:hypothetical protein